MKIRPHLFSVIVASFTLALAACSSNSPPINELPDLTLPDLRSELPNLDFSMSMSMDMGPNSGDMRPPIGSECKRNDDCAGLALCDPRLGKCVECRVSDDCATNSFCLNSRCVAAAACTSDVTCKGMNQLCDTKNGRCVDCNSAADCPGNDPKRLPDGVACLGHSCVVTRSCMSTLECSGALICAPGVPPAWPTGFNGKGCSECAATADCPATEACQGGLCVKACLKSSRKCGSAGDAVCGTCPGMSDVCSDLGNACMADYGTFLNPMYFDDMLVTKDSVFVSLRNTTSSIYKFDRAGATSRLVAVPTGYISGLAQNSTHLIFAATSKVMRMALAGGATEQIYLNSGTSTCRAIAADDTNFYCSVDGTSIIQVAIAGGMPITINDTSKAVSIDAMLVRKDKVFYGSTGGGIGGKSTIGYAPVGGGATQVLSTDHAFGKLLADDTYLYYNDFDGYLYRVAVAGGSSAENISGTKALWLESLDNGVLYVSDATSLYRLDPATKKLDPLLDTKDLKLTKVAADGNTIFGWNGARIRQVNLL